MKQVRYLFVILKYYKIAKIATFWWNSERTNTPPVFLNSEKHKVKIWQSQMTAAKYKGLFEGGLLYQLSLSYTTFEGKKNAHV